MGTVILRDIPVRFTKVIGTTSFNAVWVADHADDVSCDAIGVGHSRLDAARDFFDEIGG